MSATDKNDPVLGSFSAERLAQIRDDHEFKTGDCAPGSPWQKDPDIEALCDEVLRLQGVERDLRAKGVDQAVGVEGALAEILLALVGRFLPIGLRNSEDMDLLALSIVQHLRTRGFEIRARGDA